MNWLPGRTAAAGNVDAVMRHYVQLDEQAVTDEVTEQLSETLVLKRLGADGEENS
jgi:hypothetical protein